MDRTTFEKFGHRPMGDGRVSIWGESSNAISSTAIVLGAEDLRKLLEEVEGVRIGLRRTNELGHLAVQEVRQPAVLHQAQPAGRKAGVVEG